MSSSYRYTNEKILHFIKESKNKARFRKKPVNNSIINAFYDSPLKFFTQFHKSLKFSSYFDIC